MREKDVWNKGQQSPGSANVPAVSKETPRLPKPAKSGGRVDVMPVPPPPPRRRTLLAYRVRVLDGAGHWRTIMTRLDDVEAVYADEPESPA